MIKLLCVNSYVTTKFAHESPTTTPAKSESPPSTNNAVAPKASIGF